MLKNLLVIVGCSLPLFSSAQDIKEVRRITKTLCSPEFHGRGYVNRGDSIAAAFIANEFEKLGVQPIGESYFQEFTIDAVNTFPERTSIILNDRNLEPGVHFIASPLSGGYDGMIRPKLVSWETVFDSEKFRAITNEIAKGQEFNAIELDYVNVDKDTLKMAGPLPDQLAMYFPVVKRVNEKSTWYVAADQAQFPLVEIQDSVYRSESRFKLQLDAYQFKGYPSQNVIARIPGKKKCKKTIVFSAHYDHLGRFGEENYFPGANDNASGTAMLISMAKYFMANPPKYNTLFIAFAGEEAGLLGSKYYVEHPFFPLKDIRFLVNLDIMGSGEEGITAVNATLHKKEFKKLKKLNAKYDLLTVVKPRGPAANSDHYWFTNRNVPAFFIYTMGPNKHYHDVFDTYEELSFSEYEDITELLVRFVSKLR